MTATVARTLIGAGRAPRHRRPLPRAALRPAADAAPRAVGRGADDAGGHPGLRRHPRPLRRRGQRRRDVLHDVQAQAGRRLPRRRLHQHPVRGDGRRRDLRAPQGPPRRRQRRDHGRRQGHPRARRVQRGLRLRAGDDGQLGVHGQHDPVLRGPARRRPARGQGGHLHPRPADLHLARGRAGARRLPGRPRRRGPRGRRPVAGGSADRPRARLDGSDADRRRPDRGDRRRMRPTSGTSRPRPTRARREGRRDADT